MTEEIKCEVVTEDAIFVKVSTNAYGGLRFKVLDKIGCDLENEKTKEKTIDAYAALYAEQISTDREKLEPHQIRNLPGFKVVTVKDVTRCLKPLPLKSSAASSTALSTD